MKKRGAHGDLSLHRFIQFCYREVYALDLDLALRQEGWGFQGLDADQVKKWPTTPGFALPSLCSVLESRKGRCACSMVNTNCMANFGTAPNCSVTTRKYCMSKFINCEENSCLQKMKRWYAGASIEEVVLSNSNIKRCLRLF